jgi:hypothetical protein
MEVATLMSELGTRLASPGLQLNGLGLARIKVDEKIHVDFEHDPTKNQLYVYSVVGKLPFDEKVDTYQRLLTGNLFCVDTAGSTLAVDSQANEVVLCRVVEPDTVTTHSFISTVEGLINTALAWSSHFETSMHAENLDSKVMLHQYWRS